LGEVLPVDLDTGGLEALDEPVVGHAVGASSRVDALDPQRAEVTLARAAIAIRVVERVEHLLLRLAVEPRPLTAVAAGALENDATLLVGVDCPLHACHWRTPCFGTPAQCRQGRGRVSGRANSSSACDRLSRPRPLPGDGCASCGCRLLARRRRRRPTCDRPAGASICRCWSP